MTKKCREFSCPNCNESIYIRRLIDDNEIVLWQFPKVYEDKQGYPRITKEQVKKFFRNLKKFKGVKK